MNKWYYQTEHFVGVSSEAQWPEASLPQKEAELKEDENSETALDLRLCID